MDNNDVKAEFKSCFTTGILGFLVSVSIATGAYCMLTECSKEESQKETPRKVLKKDITKKQAKYWVPQKDR